MEFKEQRWGLTLLRIVVGIAFVLHGSQKVLGVFGGQGMEPFIQGIANMGFHPPVFWAYVAAYTEFLGGLFLACGLLTRIAAGLIAIDMLVAIVKVHLAKGFFMQNGGYEFPLVLLVACLAIVIDGHGPLSLDHLWCRGDRARAQS